MHELSRRDAVRILAAGALGAAAGVDNAAATPAALTGGTPACPPPSSIAAAAELARRLGGAEAAALPLPVRDATVLHCRSWDSSVYLYIDQSTQGFVQVNNQAFAIAAACQAAGRTVAVKVWGHDPQWADGAGRFDGAVLAIDRRNLEPPQVNSASIG